MRGENLESVKVREQIRSVLDLTKAGDIMKTEFEVVDPETTISNIVSKMRALDLHEIPVVEDNGKFVGIVSYASLIKRKNLPTTTKAKSLVEIPPKITSSTVLTDLAEKIVSTSYRQMPVIRGKKISGIVSREDIVRVVPKVKELASMPVSEIMTTDVRSVREKDPIRVAVDLMSKLEIRALPVVDESGKLTGIIGIKEIINYNWQERKRETVGELVGSSEPIEIEVGSLAVDHPLTVTPQTHLQEAIRIMIDNKISTLPIVEDDKLKGIVTTYDIVELVASFKARDMVYVQITGLEEEDRLSLDVMDEEIERELKKIAKISKPLLFTLHVSKYSETGNVAKYSLNGRLITEEKVFVAKATEWNLMKATISLMHTLSEMVKSTKDEMIDQRKKARISS
ncbi:MAG: CBS domain-containing protein [Methanomassiliicoccales archaeon]|nr:CBS domain-containing protein [Methanomassiliicoccales archaeon]